MKNHFDYAHMAALSLLDLHIKLITRMAGCSDEYLYALYQREVYLITEELDKRYEQRTTTHNREDAAC